VACVAYQRQPRTTGVTAIVAKWDGPAELDINQTRCFPFGSPPRHPVHSSTDPEM
jgi:hypothetical protein